MAGTVTSLAIPEPPVPSDAEYCRAQAAEFRRKAEETSDFWKKNELLEIANYWDELRLEYEALERFKLPPRALETPRG